MTAEAIDELQGNGLSNGESGSSLNKALDEERDSSRGPAHLHLHPAVNQHNQYATPTSSPSRDRLLHQASSIGSSTQRPSSPSAAEPFNGAAANGSAQSSKASPTRPSFDYKKTRANAPAALRLDGRTAGIAEASPSTSRLTPTTSEARDNPFRPASPRTPSTSSPFAGAVVQQQALHNPTVAFTPGSPEEEGIKRYFSPDHHHLHKDRQADRHYYIGDTGTGTAAASRPSALTRAQRVFASALMVASPRLPFYTSRDDEAHNTNNEASSPFTPHSPLYSPQVSKEVNGQAASLAFTGPSGLFSSAPQGSGKGGLLSPSSLVNGFGSTSLSASAANSQNRSPRSKRSFYKDKDASVSLYPSANSSYDSGFRRGISAPSVKTSFFRVPRSIARLVSRRSRVLPAIILCSIVFFYALGSARRSSLYDAAQSASVRQVGRFFEAADARVGHLNPMKWALEKSGEAAHQQKTFSGTGGIVEKFDVELLDPAGPLAERGTVGIAEKRYASWEGGRRDARMLVEEGKPHPIPKLMARAKQRWHALKSRQSKTFADAVSREAREDIIERNPVADIVSRYASMSGDMVECHQKALIGGMPLQNTTTYN